MTTTRPAHPPTASPERSSAPGGSGPARGPTRVAVVGAGSIADYHLAILRQSPGVELVAVVDSDRAKASAAARRFGIEHALERVAELGPLAIDVAHILVPPELHAPVATELLELGVSVFVEKPLALSSAQARELAALARERGLVLGVNHNGAFHPAFVRLLEDVRAGRIGRLQHVQVTLAIPLRQLDAGDFSHWMFRRPANIVFEQGPHPFTQVALLIGSVLELEARVLASRELQPGRIFHEKWLLSATAERGTAEIYFAFGSSFTESSIRVLGSDGALECDLHHNLYTRETKTQWLDFWDSFLSGSRRAAMLRRDARAGAWQWLKQTLRLSARNDAFYAGMRASIRAFHAALRRGEDPPFDGGRAALVLEWCEAAVAGLAPDGPAPRPLPEPGPARAGEVCVMGASGFIGAATVRALSARGMPVTAVVRRVHGVPMELESPARAGDLRLLRASLSDRAALARAVTGARTVIHLATGNGASFEEIEQTMVRGTLALAQACLEAGVQRLIYVSSTAALYLGPDCGRAILDDDVPSDSRPERRAPYARGKALTERALLAFAREHGLAVSVVRPGIVLGPGTPMQHSGIGQWVRDNHCVGWGLGEHPLPLVLVDDVADALARAAAHPGRELDMRCWNLASRVPLSARLLVEAFRDRTGRALVFHPRRLALSQTIEIVKWLVKRAGGRGDASFPSWRDLKSRSLFPALSCRTAREVLLWQPCEEARAFLDRALPARPSR